ncbi:ATP-binding cassette transporter [Clonorchis sinensis]|uniref:ATP-binding cassette transporter n=1 Tax=Clonorchis sinensis TaxID=79923 RepID=G7YVB9_CLOSI|nr:ATP-binding cassette transporter [Clonorchis sinensis]
MEKVFAEGNSGALFQLLRSTGQEEAVASEPVCEEEGTANHSPNRRLERWLSTPKKSSAGLLQHNYSKKTSGPEWNIDVSPPSAPEIQHEIPVLKHEKVPGLEGLHPILQRRLRGPGLTV